jgi:uncharacterized membrane protein
MDYRITSSSLVPIIILLKSSVFVYVYLSKNFFIFSYIPTFPSV